MEKTIFAGLAVIVVVVFVGAAGYGLWSLKRWFNYSFGYESEVRATICEMVKTEYLKEPC